MLDPGRRLVAGIVTVLLHDAPDVFGWDVGNTLEILLINHKITSTCLLAGGKPGCLYHPWCLELWLQGGFCDLALVL